MGNLILGKSTTNDLFEEVNNLIDESQGSLKVSSFSSLQEAVDEMNTVKKPLIFDKDVVESNVVSTGYTVIQGNGHRLLQSNEVGRGFNVELKGDFIGDYTSVETTPLQGSLIITTKVFGSFSLQEGDIIRLVDQATIDGLENTRHAELVKVLSVEDDHIIIDCVLRHLNYYSTGKIYKVKEDLVRINGLIMMPSDSPDELIQRISSVTVSGAILPKIDIQSEGDYTTGVSLRGCYKPIVKFLGNNLRNDDSINAFGYGVVAYSSTKAAVIETHVTGGRTSYDDGVWANVDETSDFDFGCTLDSWVTGTGIGTAGATWDTHPYSDGTTFYDTVATDAVLNTSGNTSNAFGYKIRGTNVTILNGRNNRRFTLSVGNTETMLLPSVNNVSIKEPLPFEGQDISTSKVSYEVNDSEFLLEVNIIDSYINGGWFSSDNSEGALDYVSFKNTILNFNGNRPQSSSSKSYTVTLDNCSIKNITNLRCSEKTTLNLVNCTIDSVATFSSPIELYEGGTLTLVNTGFSGNSVEDGCVRGIGTLTPATTFYYKSNYSLSKEFPSPPLGYDLGETSLKDISLLSPIS